MPPWAGGRQRGDGGLGIDRTTQELLTREGAGTTSFLWVCDIHYAWGAGTGRQEAVRRLQFSGTFKCPVRDSENALTPKEVASLIASFTRGRVSREEEEVGRESG